MIAAAIQNKLWFNWFDVALVVMLGIGFWRGRKHGMSKEMIPFFRWMFIVIIGACCYSLLGDLLIHSGVIRYVFGRSASGRTAAYITSYLLIAGVIWLAFVYIGRWIKPKLDNSSIFGSSEYYLGMVAGTLRYACISVFALALLHAPYYTSQELAAQRAYNNRWYGGGMKDFSGDYIPSVDEAQADVFTDSLFGPFIDKHLTLMLICTGPATDAKPAVVDIQQ